MTTKDQTAPPPGPTSAVPSVSTLGARLDVLGRDLAERHLTDPPWVAPLTRVLERAHQLTGSHSERFERHESTRVGPLAVAAPAEPRQGPWPGVSVRHEGAARQLPTVELPDRAERLERGSGPDEQAGERAPRPAELVRPLPVDVRAALRDIVGQGADAMVVLEGPESDAIARRHSSDAVTIGRDVHMRSGRLAPDTAEGFGLLAHEAGHVRAGLNGAPHTQGHPDGRAFEEQDALVREAIARKAFTDRQAGRVPAPTSGAAAVAPGPAVAADVTGAAHDSPMTANSQRTVDADPAGGSFDLEQLRRGVIGEVMRQLRSEFERGA